MISKDLERIMKPKGLLSRIRRWYYGRQVDKSASGTTYSEADFAKSKEMK